VAIDHHGDVLARSPQFQIHALTASVQPMQGATPYVRLGNWPIVLWVALMVAAAALVTRAQK
jgi:apolipoprotein N-acyltransferase